MQMHRFFVPTVPSLGDVVVLPSDEARHAMTVLRVEVGQVVGLMDGQGVLADAVVESLGRGRGGGMSARITARRSLTAPRLKPRLYIAPPRGKAMTAVLRAATELGAWRITPVLCEYGVAKPDRGRVKEGWLADLVGAAKQSGNPFLPQLDSAVPFEEALRSGSGPGIVGAPPQAGAAGGFDLTPWEGEIGVWVGPEGGFSDAEIGSLTARGIQPVTIGPWILRVASAVPALLTWLQLKGSSDRHAGESA